MNIERKDFLKTIVEHHEFTNPLERRVFKSLEDEEDYLIYYFHSSKKLFDTTLAYYESEICSPIETFDELREFINFLKDIKFKTFYEIKKNYRLEHIKSINDLCIQTNWVHFIQNVDNKKIIAFTPILDSLL